MSEANQAMTEARTALDEDPLDECVRTFRIENEQDAKTQLISGNYWLFIIEGVGVVCGVGRVVAG